MHSDFTFLWYIVLGLLFFRTPCRVSIIITTTATIITIIQNINKIRIYFMTRVSADQPSVAIFTTFFVQRLQTSKCLLYTFCAIINRFYLPLLQTDVGSVHEGSVSDRWTWSTLLYLTCRLIRCRATRLIEFYWCWKHVETLVVFPALLQL